MKTSDHIRCEGFPCGDIQSGAHLIPTDEIDPETIHIIMVSEANSAGYITILRER